MTCEACNGVLFPRACLWVVGHAFSVIACVALLAAAGIVLELVLRRLRQGGRYSRREKRGQDGFKVIAFSRVSVLGNDVACVRADLIADVKLRYLVVPRSIAKDFEIEEIWVGKNSQWKSKGDISAEIFSGEYSTLASDDVDLKLDHPIALDLEPCGPMRPVVIKVRNVCANARVFCVTGFGELLQTRMN